MRLGTFTWTGAACALLAMIAACSPKAAPAPADTGTSSTTVYLVRHAEKTAEPDDPGLTEAGQARAALLADLLEDRAIAAVWSTDYRRTRDTAAPIADRLGQEVRLYDPSDLDAFADEIRAADETALVVGHSNTTPQLSEALGGEPGTPIVEADEYDRLYVLTGVGTNAVETEIQRFGAGHDGGGD